MIDKPVNVIYSNSTKEERKSFYSDIDRMIQDHVKREQKAEEARDKIREKTEN